ncbi:MAG: enoyl-CoA hydratase/isomerase family protein [Dehalococcoidia bacterium]|nr:MAG: enoyl-CoA hydratase/isomerase family protein [Dehalococcoidia bacterium]
MPYKALILEKEGSIAIITLNRPEVGNSFNLTLFQEIDHVFNNIATDSDIRAVIVTGAGEHFCTGVDLNMFVGSISQDEEQADSNETAPAQDDQTYGKGTNIGATIRMRDMNKPVIAAVNGLAMGAGFALALSCDIRIASDKARFSTAFVKRGLAPDGGGSFTLPRIIGFPRACELFLTGRTVDSLEADRIGLVNSVVPHEDLMKTAVDLASSIAKHPPLAVGITKETLYKAMMTTDIVEHMKYEVEKQDICMNTEDFLEAATAVIEKRDAVFKGR